MEKCAYIDGFLSILEKEGIDKGLIILLKEYPNLAEDLIKKAQFAFSPGYTPIPQTTLGQDVGGFAKGMWDKAKWFWPQYAQYRALKDTNYFGAGDPWTLFTEPFTGAYNLADKIPNKPLRWAAKTGIGAADIGTYAIPYYNMARGTGQGITAGVHAAKNVAQGNYGAAAIDAAGGALSVGFGGVGKALTTGARQGLKAGMREGLAAAAAQAPKTIRNKALWGAITGMGGGTQLDDVANDTVRTRPYVPIWDGPSPYAKQMQQAT